MAHTTADEILAALDALEASESTEPANYLPLLDALRTLDPATLEATLGATSEEALEGLFPRRWRNWSRNREASDLDIERPSDLGELVAIVQRAVAEGRQIKPLGAAYSCSEASQPFDGSLAVNNGQLNRLLAIDDARAGIDTSHLVRVEAGITLADLSIQLDARGLGLSNLGGFDQQTLAGVMSTGTHGTGLRHTTFSDMVESIDIVCVTPDGVVARHRFEPSGGMTDPARFPDPSRLHQDDTTFHAMVVSCGMLGVVYAITLRVVDRYFVRESHEALVFPDGYAAVLARVKAGENLSILLHPYPTLPGGRHRGLVVNFRRLTQAEVGPELWLNPPDKPEEQQFFGFLASILGTSALGALMQRFPKFVSSQVDRYLQEQAGTSFTSASWKTFPKSTGDRFRAVFSEMSLPIDALGGAVEAVLAQASARTDRYRYLVPFALRFVGPSRHYLSMHVGRDSGTFEAFMLNGMENPTQALRDIEILVPQGRPHWGQLHFFPTISVADHYPQTWAAFMAQYQHYNAIGTFDGPITHRLGLSVNRLT